VRLGDLMRESRLNDHSSDSIGDVDMLVRGAHTADTATVNAATFTIGDLAREFGVTLRTLRFYEDKGLLAPRREGLTRYYSMTDRSRLAVILKGKRLGFTLTEIRGMIAAEEGTGAPAELRLGREKCVEQITVLERQMRETQEAIAELKRTVATLDGMIGRV
jgi:DNA-binding transcriptional MerR regulator